MKKRIVIAGGSGFIGSALSRELVRLNYDVVILTRLPRGHKGNVREIEWDGKNIGAWSKELDGAEAIVNLAGRTVHCVHTPKNLREINESRVNSVRVISLASQQVNKPPRAWLQASGVGFYGEKGNSACDESSPPGDDSLAKICRQWEGAFHDASLPANRRVVLRIGVALGNGGGGFPVLVRLTKFFLGGSAGNGRQFASWIHLADLARMFAACVEDEELSGTFNAVAPNAVSNAELMREFRRALHRPWSPPAPELAVRFGARLMRTEASFALTSCRAVPKKFLEMGFQFQFPELRGALADLYK